VIKPTFYRFIKKVPFLNLLATQNGLQSLPKPIDMNSQNDALNEPVYIKGKNNQKIRSKKCPFILLLTYALLRSLLDIYPTLLSLANTVETHTILLS